MNVKVAIATVLMLSASALAEIKTTRYAGNTGFAVSNNAGTRTTSVIIRTANCGFAANTPVAGQSTITCAVDHGLDGTWVGDGLLPVDGTDAHVGGIYEILSVPSSTTIIISGVLGTTVSDSGFRAGGPWTLADAGKSDSLFGPNPGDTVKVYVGTGTYPSKWTLGKAGTNTAPITYQACDSNWNALPEGSRHVVSTGATGDCSIELGADNITLIGFEGLKTSAAAGNYGIEAITNANGCILYDCKGTGAQIGIYFTSGGNMAVRCVASGCGYGLYGTNVVVFRECSAYDCTYGATVSISPTLSWCRFRDCALGIYCLSNTSFPPAIDHCSFHGGTDGIKFVGQTVGCLAHIANNIFDSQSGYGITADGAFQTLEARNNAFWGCTNVIRSAYFDGRTDDSLADAPGVDWAALTKAPFADVDNDDWSLVAGSEAIDGGTPEYLDCGAQPYGPYRHSSLRTPWTRALAVVE